MTGMDGKKDPGKFTVRFNLHDPQQRQAAELLNQQGRSKAQFIANAVLHYAGGPAPTPPRTPAMDSEQLRSLVEDILAQREARPGGTDLAPNADTDDRALYGTDRDAIFRTLSAFQQQQ